MKRRPTDVSGVFRSLIERRIAEVDASDELARAAQLRAQAESAPTPRTKKRLLDDAERLAESHARRVRAVSGLKDELDVLNKAMCPSREFVIGTVLMNLAGNAVVPSFVSGDKCSCGAIMSIHLEGSQFRCPNCGLTKLNTAHMVDSANDMVSEGISAMVHPVPAASASSAAVAAAAVVPVESSAPVRRGGPCDLYRDYLEQFAEDVPEIRASVIDTIRTQLFLKRHVNTSDRIKITLLTTLLRECGFPDVIRYASRLEMMLTGREVPKIPRALINRLVERFRIIDDIYRKNNKGKSINHKALTKISLLCENRPDLEKLFSNHRAMDAIRTERKAVQLCYSIAREKSPGYNWEWPYLE